MGASGSLYGPFVYNMADGGNAAPEAAKGDRLELKELLDNPSSAAFSRLKYLPRLGYDDQIAEFVNGLFLAAAEAKYEGDWDKLSDFLDRWEEIAIGLQFAGMRMPDVDGVPWAPLSKPLDQARVALVTTGGVFLEGQTPYTERGDATYREVPRDSAHDQLHIWHPGYDFGPAMQDINCIFPLDRFDELEAEGAIGELADINYSFMGLIPDPATLMSETAPEVGQRLKDAGVDAAFLAST